MPIPLLSSCFRPSPTTLDQESCHTASKATLNSWTRDEKLDESNNLQPRFLSGSAQIPATSLNRNQPQPAPPSKSIGTIGMRLNPERRIPASAASQATIVDASATLHPLHQQHNELPHSGTLTKPQLQLQGCSSCDSVPTTGGSKSSSGRSEAGSSSSSKVPSSTITTRSSAPTNGALRASGTSIFELSTSALLAQRRTSILKPMTIAYTRTCETETPLKAMGQRHSLPGSTGSGLPYAFIPVPSEAPAPRLPLGRNHSAQPGSFGAPAVSGGSLGVSTLRRVLSSQTGWWSRGEDLSPDPRSPLTKAALPHTISNSPSLSSTKDSLGREAVALQSSQSTQAGLRQNPNPGLPRAISLGSSLGSYQGTGSSSLMVTSYARMQSHMIAEDAAAALSATTLSAAGAAEDASRRGADDKTVARGSGAAKGALDAAAADSPGVTAEDEATARRFAEAYLKAVTSGDGEWASKAEVTEAFDPQARLTTHDGQKYIGRTAVINRLNQGMQQFLKMVGHQPSSGQGTEGTEATTTSRLSAAKLHTQLHIRVLIPGDNPQAATSSSASIVNKGAWAMRVWWKGLVGRRHRLKLRSGSSSSSSSAGLSGARSIGSGIGSSGAGARGKSPRLVATYSFKYGIRKMTVTDTLRLKQGRITSLKRTFKL